MTDALRDLPTRGNLRPGQSFLIGKQPVNYICDHSTEPEASQLVSPTNLLLESLLKGNEKAGPIAKGRKKPQPETQKADAKRRPAEAGSSAAQKRQKTGGGKSYTAQQLRGKSNQELSEILKELGLQSSGRKEALIERILKK